MAEFNVEERARLSAGQSAAVIHDAVVEALTERGIRARCFTRTPGEHPRALRRCGRDLSRRLSRRR